MSSQPDHRAGDRSSVRVLFCFGVTPSFFDADEDELAPVIPAIREAYSDLAGRFGITVLGAMDDDELMVGPSLSYPWTAYVLADAPDLAAVAAVCNILRETRVGSYRLWRYMRVEAKVGRELFFATA